MSDVKQGYGYILLIPQEGSEMCPGLVEEQNVIRNKLDAELRRKIYVATGQMPERTVVARVTWEKKNEA